METILQKSPNFGLCACAKVQFLCIFPWNYGIFSKILLHCGKVLPKQSRGKIRIVAPKIQLNDKKPCFLRNLALKIRLEIHVHET